MEIYFHLDFDAFFASVEEILHPQYQNHPLIVGGTSTKSVCCSANYLARSYGVKAGMPVFQIQKLVPKNTIYVNAHHQAYEEISKQVFKYIKYKFNRNIFIYSVDECWLKWNHQEEGWETWAINLAKRIQDDIMQTFHLSSSIGIGQTKFIAKMASDMKKPYGVFCIANDEDVAKYIWPLPINKMFMVGNHLALKLKKVGINTIGDLANYPRPQELQKIWTKHYIDYVNNAKGKNDGFNFYHDLPKSFSIKRTFINALFDGKELRDLIHLFADNLATYMQEVNASCKRISCVIEELDYTFHTNLLQYRTNIKTAHDLFNQFVILFDKTYGDSNYAIRSLGFCLTRIEYEDQDLQLKLNDLDKFNDEYKQDYNWRMQVQSLINQASKNVGKLDDNFTNHVKEKTQFNH